MKFKEFKHEPVKPDTYEASMALNQLLKIGKHAIKIHNMIDDRAEMEAWVAKKIDLAGDYVKKVHGYMQGEKAGLYDDGGMTEMKRMPKGTGTMQGVKEDAGEGHMSKSTLYHTAKYAIELMQMINKGDDLEGWVQSKLNKAADYLQGVYNYEEYQKLNPYREELDSNILQKHAQVVQKNIDEILARETKLDDIDTKPGMMRILAKRVNEVEKEIAKENRKQSETQTDESGILYRAGVKKYGKAGMKAIQSAAGKGANHQEIGKIKDKHLKDDEQIEEGLKDWAKKTAMAGVIIAGLAGVGSIQDAIDRSVPAVQAMETALELAQDQNNDELAKMIKNDLSAVKVRLSSGKDLNFVKDMQDKYSKFIQTEGLAYESKLQVQLNQQLK